MTLEIDAIKVDVDVEDEAQVRNTNPNGAAFTNVMTAEQIATVLLHHVTEGRWSAGRIASASSLTMLSGESVAISANGGVMVNDSNVIIANVAASNGFIHAIDAVLVPPSILADLGL